MAAVALFGVGQVAIRADAAAAVVHKMEARPSYCEFVVVVALTVVADEVLAWAC
jgi:hypothetical protein